MYMGKTKRGNFVDKNGSEVTIENFIGLVHFEHEKATGCARNFFFASKNHFKKVAAFHLLLRYQIQTI